MNKEAVAQELVEIAKSLTAASNKAVCPDCGQMIGYRWVPGGGRVPKFVSHADRKGHPCKGAGWSVPTHPDKEEWGAHGNVGRKVSGITAAEKTRLSLVRSSDTDEWIVKVYINGKYSEDKTYHTDDKQDAIDTMKHMKRELGITAAKSLVAVSAYGRFISDVLRSLRVTGIDPRHVEAYLRLDHGTLDALSRSDFMRETKEIVPVIMADMKAAERLAKSYGL